MKKPSCILVPIDFSETSLAALDTGVLLAAQLDAKMILLSVTEPYYLVDSSAVPHFDLEGTRARLREVLEEKARKWSREIPFSTKNCEVLALEGLIVDEILRAAVQMRADLIVMGTHGRKGWARAVLGSVTEQVLRRAPCPVLAIRSGVAVPEEGEPSRA